MHEVLKRKWIFEILFCWDNFKWTIIIRSDSSKCIEYDCMKKMTACFYVLREFENIDESVVFIQFNIMLLHTATKTASWVHSGLCSDIRDPSVLVVVLCR